MCTAFQNPLIQGCSASLFFSTLCLPNVILMGLVLIVGALVHPLSLTRKLLEQSFNQSDQSQSVSQLVNLTRFGIVLDETWNMREESLTSNIDPVYGEEVEMFCDENVREFLKRITNDVDVQRFTLESSCTSWRWKMADLIHWTDTSAAWRVEFWSEPELLLSGLCLFVSSIGSVAHGNGLM